MAAATARTSAMTANEMLRRDRTHRRAIRATTPHSPTARPLPIAPSSPSGEQAAHPSPHEHHHRGKPDRQLAHRIQQHRSDERDHRREAEGADRRHAEVSEQRVPASPRRRAQPGDRNRDDGDDRREGIEPRPGDEPVLELFSLGDGGNSVRRTVRREDSDLGQPRGGYPVVDRGGDENREQRQASQDQHPPGPSAGHRSRPMTCARFGDRAACRLPSRVLTPRRAPKPSAGARRARSRAAPSPRAPGRGGARLPTARPAAPPAKVASRRPGGRRERLQADRPGGPPGGTGRRAHAGARRGWPTKELLRGCF